jgi:glycosyltransferase involved in cell wall biosynthesis
MRKLYIDCQFFQTPAWDRGMGKYSLSLLQHSAHKLQERYDISLIFNRNVELDDKMLARVTRILPSADVIKLDLQTTEKKSYKLAANENKRELQKLGAGSDKIAPIFFIPCLFQEPTASVYPDGVVKVCIYYDAIPFLYYQKYKGAINYENYLQRYSCLLESDSLLTISQTVKDDLLSYLGIGTDGRRIMSLDGAAIEDNSVEPEKPALDLPEKFILMSTSDDIRKNNHYAVTALEQLRKLTHHDYKMVLTSSFRKEHKQELQKISENIIFSGNVNDAEMAWLYRNSRAVLCASEYEGLGLPVLEAVRTGKPVACSSIGVFNEISAEAFYYFDPLDVEDIALQLNEALEGKDWPIKEILYEAINKKYTWGRSASLFTSELEHISKETPKKKIASLPKVAVLGPTPAGYSAIGKLIQELHGVMTSHFEVDYFFENRKQELVDIRPNYLQKIANCNDIGDFNAEKYKEYDAVIYHIGNSEYHFEVVKNALYLPGFAIFHDTILAEAFGEMVKLGYVPINRYEAEMKLNELINPEHTAFTASLLNNQIGYAIHSDFAKKALASENLNQVKSFKTNLPTVVPSSIPARQKRVVRVGLAGVLSGRRKGIDSIKQLAQEPGFGKNVIFHVFGFNLMDKEEIKELRKISKIRMQTDLSDLGYQTQLANLDILINYRSEYRGETSLSTLEAMRYGCTVIVNDIGWFSEIPDEAVVKIKNLNALQPELQKLIDEPKRLDAKAKAARRYVAEIHSPKSYVTDLAHLIKSGLSSKSKGALKANIIKTSDGLEAVESKLGNQ